MTWFLIFGLVLFATAVALAVRAVAVPRARSVERRAQIEAYGFSGEGVTSGPDLSPDAPNSIADFVTTVGAFVSNRIGVIQEVEIRRELMAAGLYSMSTRTLIGYRVLAAILLPVLGAVGLSSILSPALVVLIVAVLVVYGWMLPLVLVRRAARLRLAKIDRGLPDLIDLLVVTVEAGMGFNGSLRIAARELKGPLQSELLLTLQEQAMGLDTQESLTHLLNRCETPAMRSFVRSTVQGETLGVSTGVIMRNLAVEMRKRRRAMAEEQAQKAPIKMLFPLVFLIFPTLFIVLLGPAVFSIGDAFK